MSKTLCHICFETSNLHFMFVENDNSDDLTIAEKIKEISGIEISNSDDLPQFVCTECLQKIDNFIEFKLQIKSSHEYFDIIKWEVLDGALEIEKLDRVEDQSVDTAVEGNYKLDITAVNSSELLEETVTDRKLIEDDLRASKNRKQLQCTICGKILSTKFRLKCHLIRLHTGEKPYKCNECGKSFAESPELKGHQRAHRGENFTCYTCKKAFITNRGLNKHLKIHTGHIRESIHLNRETVKRKDCKDISEIEPGSIKDRAVKRKEIVERKDCKDISEIEPGSIKDQAVCAAVEENNALDVTKAIKSEFLDDTVKNRKLNESDIINSRKEHLLCPICGKLLSSKFRLKCHLRLHTGEKPYKCDKCEKSFVEANDLKGHQRTHKGERFVCFTCNKAFMTKRGLNKHYQTHAGHINGNVRECRQIVKRKVCEKLSQVEELNSVPDQGLHGAAKVSCKLDITEVNKSEILEETLKSGKIEAGDITSSINSSQVPCAICGKLLSSKSRLKCHLRLHTGEEPYKCDKCEKSFAEAHTLKVHRRIHTGEKPLQCKFCEKKFNQGNGLRSHMRLHTRDWPYECHICRKRFKTQSPVRCHIQRQHMREKNFFCSTCNKAFITRSFLNSHLTIHTAERPHECFECGKKFAIASYLNKHTMKAHAERDFRSKIVIVKGNP